MAVKSHVAAVTLVAVLTLCRADGTELHSCGVSRPLFKARIERLRKAIAHLDPIALNVVDVT